jgi:hypothetical protein
MDVESKQTIDEGIDRAGKAGDELVDRAAKDLSDEANAVVDKLANMLSTALAGFESIALRTAGNVINLVNSLDGWTLTVDLPPIVLTLRKPR